MTTAASGQTDQVETSLSLKRRTGGSRRRVAFVGTGYIADWHAQCIKQVTNAELAAVCDRVLPKAEALARKFGVPKIYSSLEDMLVHETLDAVHVLLPPDRHFEAARTILEAGVDVFMEKPMCERAVDCESLVRIAAERGLRLGVGHNFLFSRPYERLRRDLRSGVLGQIDHVTITWHRPLPPVLHGPFNIWMLREPANILLEIGSHSAAHLLDLVGKPEEMHVHASNPVDLPTGQRFYRRWQVNALKDRTAVELRFSFVPGFSEYSIQVRGSLAAATVDFERNTYSLLQHTPNDPDFDVYHMVRNQAKSLKQQARQTLSTFFRGKLKMGRGGNPYAMSITGAMDAFYAPGDGPLDERVDDRMGADVIRLCEQMSAAANLPREAARASSIPRSVAASRTTPPRILVLGGTGFIGKELIRQLTSSGHEIRMLVRNAGNLPLELRGPSVDVQSGDLLNKQDLERAMEGIDYVLHLARANVKTWAEYQEFEIGATRNVAEAAVAAGVKRLVYTGSIASYYQGSKAGTITEATPLDKRIARANFYSRAKTASEELLLQMHREQGLGVVILRPGIVIGRGASPFHFGVGMWWNDAVCQIFGDGRNKLPLVLVEDVAAAVIAAMEKPDIEGRSFNLVGDPCLSAQEYLDELDRCAGIRIQRFPTPVFRFYLKDMAKWVVKVAVRHPERQMPTYRESETRTLLAPFDCSAAKNVLGWRPVTDRTELVRRGIEEPLKEFTR
ncbi:MAG: NAD-dependent epimerase/dehydratase family protein [Silvibacterium sp.]|nr:NAD-dependent epimerase/dehydratase family protein [Silvibacterium sp.]